jgi:3-dehydro-L-gulonate-6-phosphate decarboxylase
MPVPCSSSRSTPSTSPRPWRRCKRAKYHIDVVEAGTILCYAEGMHAVRALRALYPDKVLLADVRIAEAGSIIAKLAYDAGADWVTVVSGATPATMEVVLKPRLEGAARRPARADRRLDLGRRARWRALGIEQVIAHRSRDGEALGDLSWKPGDFDEMRRLADLGFKVTVAGGVEVHDLPLFAGVPIHVFTVGRAIRAAADPAAAAKAFQDAIARHLRRPADGPGRLRCAGVRLGVYEKALPTDADWPERLALVRRLGFDYLELSIDESDAPLARLDPASPERARSAPRSPRPACPCSASA